MKIEKLVDRVAPKGWRVIISKGQNLYTMGLEKDGKWSPPYCGFTLDEAAGDALEDTKWMEAT